jgi:hypothetical protein
MSTAKNFPLAKPSPIRPALKPLAERLLASAAARENAARGRSEEIGTREAAKILSYSIRSMNRLCEEGVLKEGVDWRRESSIIKNSSASGERGGRYKIKRASVLRFFDKKGV